jgi:hypothetical protein
LLQDLLVDDAVISLSGRSEWLLGKHGDTDNEPRTGKP